MKCWEETRFAKSHQGASRPPATRRRGVCCVCPAVVHPLPPAPVVFARLPLALRAGSACPAPMCFNQWRGPVLWLKRAHGGCGMPESCSHFCSRLLELPFSAVAWDSGNATTSRHGKSSGTESGEMAPDGVTQLPLHRILPVMKNTGNIFCVLASAARGTGTLRVGPSCTGFFMSHLPLSPCICWSVKGKEHIGFV